MTAVLKNPLTETLSGEPKSMPLHIARILLFIAALSLAACGGWSSSEVRQPTPADTLNISGIVVDGPIAGARVEIREKIGNEEKTIHQCWDTGKGTCITTTVNEGRFSFFFDGRNKIRASAPTGRSGSETCVRRYSSVAHTPPSFVVARQVILVIVNSLRLPFRSLRGRKRRV